MSPSLRGVAGDVVACDHPGQVQPVMVAVVVPSKPLLATVTDAETVTGVTVRAATADVLKV